MPAFSRRDFLKFTTSALLTASGLLGLDILFHFLDYQAEPPVKTKFDLGPASNYPIGSRLLVPEVPAVLVHDEKGFSALSLICTHLGCTVQQKPNGFTCPCHGSLYDASGNVLRGPAQRSLRVLRVEQTADGNLTLYTD